MRLARLCASGFRSLKELTVDFDPLTLLIGENDAGKSSILDLLEITLTKRMPDRLDFYCDLEGNVCEKIEAVLKFTVDADNADAIQFAIDGKLQVRRCYTLSAQGDVVEEKTSYLGIQPKEPSLRQDFSKMGADEQRGLIRSLNSQVSANEISNTSKRVEWLNHYVSTQAEVEKTWLPVERTWGSFLPKFVRYSSMDYRDPARMVANTLAQTFRRTIYEEIELADGTSRTQLIEPLRTLQNNAFAQIQADIAQLKAYIHKYDRRINDIGYQPEFDFENSLLVGEFQVNTGRGLHALSRTGDGTKRRMFMGILDWDREISLAQTAERLPPIIRAYDEPDTNLHYAAQKLMYQSINEIVHSPGSNVQAVICTHSLTMIDRAPAQSIRLLRLCPEGHTQLEQLDTNNDPEIEEFLATLARELGITNTLIFYERCFILIEGESEENAIPIFYRRLYNRSLLEDGIHIINTRGNGAVPLFLQLMSRNRQSATVVFIDRDAENQPPAKLTRKTLREAGFSQEFIDEQIVFIGTMEFEDAFSDAVLTGCLEKHWPKPIESWHESEITAIRTANKFSSDLGALVARFCPGGPYFRKPEFGERIARFCPDHEIPRAIIDLFTLARRISGVAT